MGFHLPSLCMQSVPHVQTPNPGCPACAPYLLPPSETKLDVAIWQHPTLVPLEGNPYDAAANFSHTTPATYNNNDKQEPSRGASNEHEDDTENIVDTEATPCACDGRTYHEQLVNDIMTIWDFCDGLEYQLQFKDWQMLEMCQELVFPINW